jgi:hypothetical protein
MYFLKNSVVLFVALFSEMLALKTEDHFVTKFLSRFNLN